MSFRLCTDSGNTVFSNPPYPTVTEAIGMAYRLLHVLETRQSFNVTDNHNQIVAKVTK